MSKFERFFRSVIDSLIYGYSVHRYNKIVESYSDEQIKIMRASRGINDDPVNSSGEPSKCIDFQYSCVEGLERCASEGVRCRE